MTTDADPGNVVRLFEDDSSLTSVAVSDDTDLRSLIPGGASVERAIPFDSDIWHLVGHESWRSKVGEQTKLSFAEIHARWRTAAKEWVLLCLDPSLAVLWAPDSPEAATWPEAQEPVKLVTAQANLKALRLGLAVLDRYGLFEPDTDAWARASMLLRQPQDRTDKRAGAVLSPGTLRMRAQQLRSLWSIRTIVNRPTLLGSEPFGSEDSTAIFGSGSRPKRNMRRPHEDVGLCLGMIAWVFDNIADDIIAHVRWWAENSTSPLDKPSCREDGYEAMVSLLDEIRASHRVLPACLNQSGQPTLAHAPLARLLGEADSDEAFLWGRYAMRRFRDVPLHLEGGNPCPLPIRELPRADGPGTITWTARLLDVRSELRWWASALVYYAMFYLAATCGLRDLDLDCLPPGCIRSQTARRPNGEEYPVTTMRGYKQKNRMAPIPTEWKVNGRVARIVGVIEELHEIYRITPTTNSHTGEPRLFDSQLITALQRGMRESVHLDQSFMNWIVSGARRLYDRGVTSRHLDDITKITVANVRITALQAYASRQLGHALVAQFGQWSGQAVALGYHGDIYKIIHLADPSDANDYQREDTGRTLARAAATVDELKGNGVPRLRLVIESHGDSLANPGPLSPARLRALGKTNKNLRTGPYTLCLYRSDVALCGGEGSADFRLCRPFECRNSSMTRSQRARVELRRRQEMEMAPILRRSATKLAQAMPEVVQEFRDATDEELVEIIAADLDGYINDALHETGGPG